VSKQTLKVYVVQDVVKFAGEVIDLFEYEQEVVEYFALEDS
jgi:hypothetical protein